MCSAVMLLLDLMCSAVMIVAGINVMLLLELMCSAVMFVAGINVFCCDDCAEIDAADLCAAQRNSVPLPQLNLSIRCRFVCCAAKFCFAAATEPAAAN